MKNFKSLLIDFIVNSYLVYLIYLLFSDFSQSFDRIYYLISASIILTILTFISGHSIGNSTKKTSLIKSVKFWQTFSIIIITLVVAWIVVEVNPYKFFANYKNSYRIMHGLSHPNMKIFLPMLKSLFETIYLALLATVFAIPFAFIFSFLGARNLMPKSFIGNSVFVFIRTGATIVRSIEAIVWAIIFSVWVGIGPFAGMLALMFHSIAALTKLYSEQIENIDSGQIEAMKATGANTLQVWIFAVIPQIFSPFLAFTIYRWDINIRMATIVGFVGGGGIGLALKQQQQFLRWDNVGVILWMIAVVVWAMDMISNKVRQKLLD